MILTLAMILGTIGCTNTKYSKNILPKPPDFKPITVGMPGKGNICSYAAGRMAAFAKEDVSKLQGSIVLLGASIEERYPIGKFFPNLKIVNRGIGGDTIGGWYPWGMMDRLESSVYNLHPRMIILCIGVNDIIWITTEDLESKIKRYDYLLWTLHKNLPNTEIYTVSATPCRGEYGKFNKQIRLFNDGIKTSVPKYGFKYVDLYDQFTDEQGLLKAELASDDIHLTEKGYELTTRIYNKEIFKVK